MHEHKGNDRRHGVIRSQQRQHTLAAAAQDRRLAEQRNAPPRVLGIDWYVTKQMTYIRRPPTHARSAQQPSIFHQPVLDPHTVFLEKQHVGDAGGAVLLRRGAWASCGLGRPSRGMSGGSGCGHIVLLPSAFCLLSSISALDTGCACVAYRLNLTFVCGRTEAGG